MFVTIPNSGQGNWPPIKAQKRGIIRHIACLQEYPNSQTPRHAVERYIGMVLPFGLRSAQKIFTAEADMDHMAEWIVLMRGVSWCLHYIDDFLIRDSRMC